jgi:hypothetical protein
VRGVKGRWATVRRIGIGILILASSCARLSIAPSPITSPTHAAEPGEPALVHIDGYSYEDADEAMEARLRAYLEMHSSAYEGGSAHEVATDDGQEVGTLFLIDVRLYNDPPLELPGLDPYAPSPSPYELLESAPESMVVEALNVLSGDLRGVRTYGEVPTLPGWVYRTTADGGDVEAVGYAWIHPYPDDETFAVLLGSDAEAEEAFLTETLRPLRS